MKKLLTLSVLLICFSCFAIGPVKTVESHDFDSIPMLEKFYNEKEIVDEEFWNDTKISLITISKGDELYSWFGHTGMMVEKPNRSAVFYDYGRFAFSKDFYINFIKGQLWFGCAGFYAEYEFEDARDKGRTISKVELNLTAQQKEAISKFLETNIREPYDRYLYHHFKDNCATRIRDIINYATGGDFEKWAKAQSGYTFRDQTSRVLHNTMFIEWVLDLLQGPSVDAEATLWDEMFLPENLEKALLDYGKVTDNFSYIEDFRDTDKRPINYVTPQNYVAQSMLVGLIAGAIAMILAIFSNKGYIIETSIINGVLAIIGIVMFYMMFFSDHSFAWNNENILFINPLLLVPFICGFKRRKHMKTLTVSYGTLTFITAIMQTVKMFAPQLLAQANYPQLTAALPYYFANFIVCLAEVF